MWCCSADQGSSPKNRNLFHVAIPEARTKRESWKLSKLPRPLHDNGQGWKEQGEPWARKEVATRIGIEADAKWPGPVPRKRKSNANRRPEQWVCSAGSWFDKSEETGRSAVVCFVLIKCPREREGVHQSCPVLAFAAPEASRFSLPICQSGVGQAFRLGAFFACCEPIGDQ